MVAAAEKGRTVRRFVRNLTIVKLVSLTETKSKTMRFVMEKPGRGL